MDFEFRTDHNITSANNKVERKEYRRFHNIPHKGDVGGNTTVCVMDSGIDDTHPVFEGNSVEHADVTGNGEGDEVGHGTAVAGTIAYLAPEIDIISLRIFGDSGRTDMGTIMSAYDWLEENSDRIDFVNMSWGARSKSQQIDNRHNQVTDGEMLDIVAAGNTGDRGGSPATAETAYSTGACTEEGKMTRFSSYNPNHDNPDVTAIGKDVVLPRAEGTSMGTPINDKWTKASGTSFSAPILTGAGVVWKELQQRGYEKPFEQYARDIKGVKKDGEGILDYEAAADGDKPKPSTGARVFNSFLGQIALMDTPVLKQGDHAVDIEEKTEEKATLTFHFE